MKTAAAIVPTVLIGLFASLVASEASSSVTLTAADPLTLASDSPVVLCAALDVARDLKGVFEARVTVAHGASGRLVVAVEPHREP